MIIPRSHARSFLNITYSFRISQAPSRLCPSPIIVPSQHHSHLTVRSIHHKHQHQTHNKHPLWHERHAYLQGLRRHSQARLRGSSQTACIPGYREQLHCLIIATEEQNSGRQHESLFFMSRCVENCWRRRAVNGQNVGEYLLVLRLLFTAVLGAGSTIVSHYLFYPAAMSTTYHPAQTAVETLGSTSRSRQCTLILDGGSITCVITCSIPLR